MPNYTRFLENVQGFKQILLRKNLKHRYNLLFANVKMGVDISRATDSIATMPETLESGPLHFITFRRRLVSHKPWRLQRLTTRSIPLSLKTNVMANSGRVTTGMKGTWAR